jgi:hypothetical protein
LGDGLEQLVDLLAENLAAGEIVQRFGYPETPGDGIVALARRIEYVLKPGLSVLELLVLA